MKDFLISKEAEEEIDENSLLDDEKIFLDTEKKDLILSKITVDGVFDDKIKFETYIEAIEFVYEPTITFWVSIELFWDLKDKLMRIIDKGFEMVKIILEMESIAKPRTISLTGRGIKNIAILKFSNGLIKGKITLN